MRYAIDEVSVYFPNGTRGSLCKHVWGIVQTCTPDDKKVVIQRRALMSSQKVQKNVEGMNARQGHLHRFTRVSGGPLHRRQRELCLSARRTSGWCMATIKEDFAEEERDGT